MAVINGTPGDDNYAVGTGTTNGDDRVYAGAGNDYVDGGDGNDALFGGEGTDTLIGGAGNDFLDGGTGDDRMEGGSGNDTYIVDSVGDVVFEEDTGPGGGVDTVRSYIDYRASWALGVEKFELWGTDDLNFRGDDRDNTIKGNSGANNIGGAGGNDFIYGGDGNDIILGGAGNDVLAGEGGVDLVSYKDATGGVTVSLAITSAQNVGGGAGTDRLSGFENLEGSEFADKLTGDAGNNKILGLGGGDTIRGGAGDDDITGGAGNDRFVFETAALNGVDVIRQFTSGQDKLVFSAADYAATTLTVHTLKSEGSTSASGDAQFIFNQASGQLYYDADGTGAGAATHIANLANNPAVILTWADFEIA